MAPAPSPMSQDFGAGGRATPATVRLSAGGIAGGSDLFAGMFGGSDGPAGMPGSGGVRRSAGGTPAGMLGDGSGAAGMPGSGGVRRNAGNTPAGTRLPSAVRAGMLGSGQQQLQGSGRRLSSEAARGSGERSSGLVGVRRSGADLSGCAEGEPALKRSKRAKGGKRGKGRKRKAA